MLMRVFFRAFGAFRAIGGFDESMKKGQRTGTSGNEFSDMDMLLDLLQEILGYIVNAKKVWFEMIL